MDIQDGLVVRDVTGDLFVTEPQDVYARKQLVALNLVSSALQELPLSHA